jgi:hypothetical protein
MPGSCIWGLGLLSISLFLVGCGEQGLEMVKVSGQVTFDGSEMPGPGTLFFTPVDAAEGLPKRPAVADFAVDGRYRASSFGRGKGLVPGRYLVAVHCWKTAYTMESGPVDSYIPIQYTRANTSNLELIVPSGEQEITWDVPLRKADAVRGK